MSPCPAGGAQVHCSLESCGLPVLGCNLGSIPTAPRYASVMACCLLTPAWPAGLAYAISSRPSQLCSRWPVSPSLYSLRRFHSAFVFLTGSCDRRQIMSTKARETKNSAVQIHVESASRATARAKTTNIYVECAGQSPRAIYPDSARQNLKATEATVHIALGSWTAVARRAYSDVTSTNKSFPITNLY